MRGALLVVGAAFKQALDSGYEDAQAFIAMDEADADQWRPSTATRLAERLGVTDALKVLGDEIKKDDFVLVNYTHRLQEILRAVYGVGLKIGGLK